MALSSAVNIDAKLGHAWFWIVSSDFKYEGLADPYTIDP